MIRFFTLLIILLLLVTTATIFVTRNSIEVSAPIHVVKGEGTALIGGDFVLVNQDGVTVSDKDFRGKVMMVFFGFTHCPDICSVTAATFAKVLELLGDKSSAVAPIFITIDPERDTPEVLKEYLSNIDSRIIGLSGTKEQVGQVASAYKAYFTKTPNAHEHGHENGHGNGHDEHKIDHSGFVYIMDKKGVYIKHFPYDADAQEIVDEISALLK